MKNAAHHIRILIGIAIMVLMIMDTKTATYGATEGLEQCIRVIMPSLFPFFIVSTYLNTALLGHKIPLLHAIGKWLRIPNGGESILLIGLTGGYPVGAQLIAQAHRNQQISKRTYEILLGYCNNAGPAFLFGIAGSLFTSKITAFTLWGIHIMSAIITGFLLPKPKVEEIHWNTRADVSLINAVKKSINVCASTCSWIIIFKILLAYLTAWLSSISNHPILIFISGLLELSNGCLQLSQLTSEPLRFILCSVFLSFGGICVLLQTFSVTDGLGLGLYLPGKIIQTAVSTLIALLFTGLLFPHNELSILSISSTILICFLTLVTVKCFVKKVWQFSDFTL